MSEMVKLQVKYRNGTMSQDRLDGNKIEVSVYGNNVTIVGIFGDVGSMITSKSH